VLNRYRADPRFAPAPNVIDGISVERRGNGQCSTDEADPEDPEYTMPLPVDDCFFSEDGCTLPRFSEGYGISADHYDDYLETNYGITPGGTPPSWFPAWPTTLYDIYIAENRLAVRRRNPRTGRASGNRRRGLQSPWPRQSRAPGADRGRHRLRHNPINGSTEDVPVAQWFRAFIIRPADGVTKDVFVEVIGSAELGNGGSGQIRDVIRLYR
jgi:hypothetical protein